MKYCRFQRHGQAQYGLVEPFAGHDLITRLLVTPPEEAGGDRLKHPVKANPG